MDNDLFIFYKTLDPKKFKYFLINNLFYIFNSDIEFLPSEIQGKATNTKIFNNSCRTIKLQEIDAIIKELLVNKKVVVEEYQNKKVNRTGCPSNYNDFLAICLSDTIVPTIGSIANLDNNNRLQFSYARDSTLYFTEYTDDDLFSITYSLVSTYNCMEMLFHNPAFRRVFLGWGIEPTLLDGHGLEETTPAVSLISKFCKRKFCIEKFFVDQICLVDINQFDLVDFGCTTLQGKRLMSQWVRSPTTSVDEINKRLDLSEAFAEMNVFSTGFSDLKRIALKISSSKITINETINLYQTLKEIPGILKVLKSYCSRHEKASDKIHDDFIVPLENLEKIFGPLCLLVLEKIDLNSGRIITEIDEELTCLVSKKHAVYSEIEKEFIQAKKNYPRLKFQNNYFKISRSEYRQEDFRRYNYSCVSILKNGVFFVSKFLKEQRTILEELENEITLLENQIFGSVKDEMMKYINSIEIYNFIIALMDIYNAFGMKTKLSNYCRQKFSETEYKVEGFFHPMLEHSGYVGNDIDFGNNKIANNINDNTTTNKEVKRVCVLTGPNMGGKSTVMKSLSMVSLYAQLGSYVPASSAVLPIFDRIFLRMGAKDYSSRGLSTYMVEMVDLKKILCTASRNSLILIDELGRGTSAVDGLSLVLAVKEHLLELGAWTIISTHFSEVGDDSTFNIKMMVSDTLLTYKIGKGNADGSFAINVAKIAGFPDSVIENTKKYLEKYESKN